MSIFLTLADTLLSLYLIAIVIAYIASFIFDPYKPYHNYIYSLLNILGRITDPVFNLVNKVVRLRFERFDLTPAIVCIIIILIKAMLP